MKENEKIQRFLKVSLAMSVDKCSNLLSKFIKKGTKIEFDTIEYCDIKDITENLLNQDDREIVASFIDFWGDASFKFLFYVNHQDCLTLTDLILQREVGTTKEFNVYSRSAVQEISNILASIYTNVFAKDFVISLSPSTPSVIKGPLSTVLSQFSEKIKSQDNHILLMENILNVVGFNIRCYTLIIPVAESEALLEGLVSTV